jgi:hypothetical protein
MKFFPISFLLIILFSCSAKKKAIDDFQKFSNRFQLINFPFVTNDLQLLRYWDKENLIDTNFVMQFGLTEKYADNENPQKNISDYKCTYISTCEAKNYFVFLYKMYTSNIGNGKPVIALATFSKEGKKVDQMTAVWTEVQTEWVGHNIILTLLDNRRIEIKSITTDYGYLNNQKVEKKKNLKLIQYEIDKDGKIIKLQEISNDVFKDDNPKIVGEIKN